MAKEQIEADEDGREWFIDEEGYRAFRLEEKTWYLFKDAALIADQSERNIELWTDTGVLPKQKAPLPGTRKGLRFVDIDALRTHAETRPTKEKSTDLVPISLMQDHMVQLQELNDRIARLTKDATNAVAEAEFQKERVKTMREERDALKAELEERETEKQTALEQRLAELEAKLETPEPIVDLTDKKTASITTKKSGFFARLRGA